MSTSIARPDAVATASEKLGTLVAEVLKREISEADYDADFESLNMDSMDVISLMLLIEEEFTEFSDYIDDDAFIEEMRRIGTINGIAAHMVKMSEKAE